MDAQHALIQKLVLEAFDFSISAHNVQPFRIKWSDDGLELWAQSSRFLPAADPQNKDLIKSSGATFEALRLYLGMQGFAVAVETAVSNQSVSVDSHNHAFIAKFKVQQGTRLSDEDLRLAAQLPKRFSYRGFFKNSVASLSPSQSVGDLELKFLVDSESKSKIGELYDNVNIKFLNLPGYALELSSWLRLSRKHPRWSQDGLNSEAMSLSAFDAFGASFIFKPFIFKIVNALGLAKLLMAEKPKIESASALVALTGPKKDAFETGRAFLRGWLHLTSLDLFGAPLSLLTDDEAATQVIKQTFQIDSSRDVYNVVRVGPLPQGFVRYQPARRAKIELMHTEGT